MNGKILKLYGPDEHGRKPGPEFVEAQTDRPGWSTVPGQPPTWDGYWQQIGDSSFELFRRGRELVVRIDGGPVVGLGAGTKVQMEAMGSIRVITIEHPNGALAVNYPTNDPYEFDLDPADDFSDLFVLPELIERVSNDPARYLSVLDQLGNTQQARQAAHLR